MVQRSIVVLLFILMTSILFESFCFSAIELPDVKSPAFKIPSKEFKVVQDKVGPNKPIIQDNLPPVHPQDGLPLCCSEAARTMFLQYKCNYVLKPDGSKNDCNNYDPKLVPSVLSMAAVTNEGFKTSIAKLKQNDPLPTVDTFGLEFVLEEATSAGTVLPETCFPMDQFVAQFQTGNINKNLLEEENAFTDLKAQFENAKKKQELEALCTACLDDLFKSLNTHFAIIGRFSDIAQLRNALTEDTFEKFLHKILLGSCKDKLVMFKQPPTFKWPENLSDRRTDYEDSIKQIKKLLGENISVGLSVCPYSEPKNIKGHLEACDGGIHCVVITGYEKTCKPDGTCMDLVRVHNSWGLDWQKENNDGWVDAKTLTDHADLGRSSQLLYFSSSGNAL